MPKDLINTLLNDKSVRWFLKCVFEGAFVKTIGKGGGSKLIKTKLEFN